MPEPITLFALIVESDLLIRAHISERLNKHAIRCIEADNGMVALEQLEHHEIDFVIADLHMKKMDGIQFIEIVHRNHKDMPVVAAVDADDTEATLSAFKAGVVNVIKKVGSLEALEAIVLPITDLIEKRKSRFFDFKSVRYLTEELTIGNDPNLIPVTVGHLLGYLKQSKFAGRLTGLEVVLYEMIANAIEHGNLAITKEEKEQALTVGSFNELLLQRGNHPHYKNRIVKIKFNYNSRQLTVSIADQGSGFNLERLKSVSPENMLAQSGRGILLSKMYCDEMLYNKTGNKVTLVLKADSESHKEAVVHALTREFPNPHILIVDNNPQMLRHISNLIEEIGFTFGYIAHSHHLLPRLEEEKFDLILLDVSMPKQDGLSLLRELQDHTLYRRIPVIMLTSDKNDRLMAECFTYGAEDFIVKPVNKLALHSRIKSTLTKQESFKQIGQANEKLEVLNQQLQEQYDILIQTQAELQKKHQQIEDDIHLAERIQRNMLSSELNVPFLKMSVVFQPHSIVSGDFHFQEPDQAGNLNVFLGDATGHGVSAAFLTMLVRMALGMTSSELPPDEILRSLNRQLAACVPRGDHMTGVMLKIAPDGNVVGCSAGGPPALIVSEDKPAVLIFTGGGQALGMFADERIPYIQESFQLHSGDRIVLFTDGVPEWRNRHDLPFGMEKIKSYLEQHSQAGKKELLNGLLAEVIRFASPNTQIDDATLIALEYLPPV